MCMCLAHLILAAQKRPKLPVIKLCFLTNGASRGLHFQNSKPECLAKIEFIEGVLTAADYVIVTYQINGTVGAWSDLTR